MPKPHIEDVEGRVLVSDEADKDLATANGEALMRMRNRANKAEAALERLREGLRAEVEHQQTIATNAGSESISLGAESEFDGEKEAKLIEIIAKNTLRFLEALLEDHS